MPSADNSVDNFCIEKYILDKSLSNLSLTKRLILYHKDKKIILVTHAPPYKTRLDKLAGEHCGNKSIRNFIEKSRSDLVICGHLHENFGREDKIKRTRIINPGHFGKVISI